MHAASKDVEWKTKKFRCGWWKIFRADGGKFWAFRNPIEEKRCSNFHMKLLLNTIRGDLKTTELPLLTRLWHLAHTQWLPRRPEHMWYAPRHTWLWLLDSTSVLRMSMRLLASDHVVTIYVYHIPTGVSRETVMETLHDHLEMIDLNHPMRSNMLLTGGDCQLRRISRSISILKDRYIPHSF